MCRLIKSCCRSSFDSGRSSHPPLPVTGCPGLPPAGGFALHGCRVPAGATGRMAPAQARDRHPAAVPGAMMAHAISSIIRTCGEIAALAPNEGRQCDLVKPLGSQQDARRHREPGGWSLGVLGIRAGGHVGRPGAGSDDGKRMQGTTGRSGAPCACRRHQVVVNVNRTLIMEPPYQRNRAAPSPDARCVTARPRPD